MCSSLIALLNDWFFVLQNCFCVSSSLWLFRNYICNNVGNFALDLALSPHGAAQITNAQRIIRSIVFCTIIVLLGNGVFESSNCHCFHGNLVGTQVGGSAPSTPTFCVTYCDYVQLKLIQKKERKKWMKKYQNPGIYILFSASNFTKKRRKKAIVFSIVLAKNI